MPLELLSLQKFQQLFADNLISEQISDDIQEQVFSHIVSDSPVADAQIEALERFSIYRNNVILSLSEAMADTYPVVKRLLGEEYFTDIAIAFVRKFPPKHGSLLFYGDGFSDFLNTSPGAAELGYIADVAILEWHYNLSFHAADADLMQMESLQAVGEEQLGDVSFTLHPSVHLQQSAWPVDTIWYENLQDEVGEITLEDHHSSNMLICREHLQVKVFSLSLDCYRLLSALFVGNTIAQAWSFTVAQKREETGEMLQEEELGGLLAYLLSLPIFTGVVL